MEKILGNVALSAKLVGWIAGVTVAIAVPACSDDDDPPTTTLSGGAGEAGAAGAAGAASFGGAGGARGSVEVIDCSGGEEVEDLAVAKLFIEYNATDGDLGVQGIFQQEGFSELCVFAPNGSRLLGVRPDGALGVLTLDTFSFESLEPELSDFGFTELAERFPEGEYEVRAVGLDRRVHVGSATFTHDVPAEPQITAPELGGDPEEEAPPVLPLQDLVVQWEEVTEDAVDGTVVVTGYEVIVTNEDVEDENGASVPIFDVHVAPDRRSLTISTEFLEANTLYEVEVLAIETSGNQTIAAGFFRTE